MDGHRQEQGGELPAAGTSLQVTCALVQNAVCSLMRRCRHWWTFRSQDTRRTPSLYARVTLSEMLTPGAVVPSREPWLAAPTPSLQVPSGTHEWCPGPPGLSSVLPRVSTAACPSAPSPTAEGPPQVMAAIMPDFLANTSAPLRGLQTPQHSGETGLHCVL